MKRPFLSFCLAVVGIACLAFTAGCHKGGEDSTLPAKPGAPINPTQAAQSVNDNPNLNPEMKARLSSQMQNPSGRPPGAAAVPQAH